MGPNFHLQDMKIVKSKKKAREKITGPTIHTQNLKIMKSKKKSERGGYRGWGYHICFLFIRDPQGIKDNKENIMGSVLWIDGTNINIDKGFKRIEIIFIDVSR